MKKLEVGDKVRFLNSVGGGTIKGFLNKQIAIVEDEHNFDVPILISECVLIEQSDNIKLSQSVESIKDERSNAEQNNKQANREAISEPSSFIETLEGEKITSCLVFLPTDYKNFSQTNFECYFINDSNYFLFFNYMSRENNSWISRYNGIIEPNTQIFIEEFDKSKLNELEQVCVQFIAFKKDKTFRFKEPISVEIRVDTVKFYKLHSFTESDYFEENAITLYITKDDLPERGVLVSSSDIQRAMQEKQLSESRPKSKQIKKKEKQNIIEVDLHINNLLDTTAGMNNSDMLEYQMAKFNEIMHTHIKHRGQKIVFIHGKGDGILKNSILKELKNKYKNCYVQDASFREYGYGATMVTINENTQPIKTK